MSSSNDGSEISDDSILLGFIVALALGCCIIPFGAVLAPVKDWLLRYQPLIEGNCILLEIPGTGAA